MDAYAKDLMTRMQCPSLGSEFIVNHQWQWQQKGGEGEFCFKKPQQNEQKFNALGTAIWRKKNDHLQKYRWTWQGKVEVVVVYKNDKMAILFIIFNYKLTNEELVLFRLNQTYRGSCHCRKKTQITCTHQKKKTSIKILIRQKQSTIDDFYSNMKQTYRHQITYVFRARTRKQRSTLLTHYSAQTFTQTKITSIFILQEYRQ